MILVEVSRPNTVGVTTSKEFDSCEEAKQWIEKKSKSLESKGWNVSELSGSKEYKGTIEATHDEEADVLLITWIAAECDTEIEEKENPAGASENFVWILALAFVGFMVYKLKKEHKSYSIDFVNKNSTPTSIVAGVRG